MYGFLYQQGAVGQYGEPMSVQPTTTVRPLPVGPQPIVPPRATLPAVIAANPCFKPASVATWLEWFDRVAPGWVTFDTSDPNTILGQARCPGAPPSSVSFEQRFPRHRTNQYVVAFRRLAAEQIACICCRQCPMLLPGRLVPGTCGTGYTKLTLSAHLTGGGMQELCSICVPQPFVYAASGEAARICAALPSIYPGSVAPSS